MRPPRAVASLVDFIADAVTRDARTTAYWIGYRHGYADAHYDEESYE